MGYETIIVNNNPETVSTDFDIADKLYFEPLTEEDVEHIVELDSFLEKTIDTTGAIPDEMKHLSNMDRLNSLIDKVDQLIGKFE